MKTRTHKLVKDNPEANVKGLATYRLNQAIKAIQNFGQCFGNNYAGAWTSERIEKADLALMNAVEQAITNIKEGKQIADVGIVL